MEKKSNSIRDSISLLVSMCLHGSAIAVIVLGPAYLPGVLNGSSKNSDGLIVSMNDQTELVEFTVPANEPANETQSAPLETSAAIVPAVVKTEVKKETSEKTAAVKQTPKIIKVAEIKKSPIQDLPEKSPELVAPVVQKPATVTEENAVVENSEVSVVEEQAAIPVVREQETISVDETKQDETVIDKTTQEISKEEMTAMAAPAIIEETKIVEPLVENSLSAQEVTQEEIPAQDIAKEINETNKVVPPALTENVSQEQIPTQVTPEVSSLEKMENGAQTSITNSKANHAAADTQGNSNIAQSGPAIITANRSYLNLKQMNGNVPPSYTRDMRLNRLEGRGELVCFVSKKGQVTNMKVSRSTGSNSLDQAALNAFSKYKFEPNQEGFARFPFEFTLKGPAISDHSRLRTSRK